MKFVAGICPQCGGEIQLDPDKESGYCMHCGVKIFTNDAVHYNLDKIRIENYLKLAEEAIESGNKQEALLYANRVLEIDPFNTDAWYAKMRVSEGSKEIINCVQNIIDYIDDDKLEVKSSEIWAYITSSITNQMDDIIKRSNDTRELKIKIYELAVLNDKTAIYHMLSDEKKLMDALAKSMNSAIITYHELMKFNFGVFKEQKANVSYKIAVKFVEFILTITDRAKLYKGRIETYSSLRKVLDSILLNVQDDHARRIKMDWNRFFASSQIERETDSCSNEVEIKIKRNACYIATAVYGSYDAPNVMVLRNYRDTVLASNTLGRMFIKVYYKLSPPVAERLEKHNKINQLVKNILDRWVRRLKKKHNLYGA